MLTSCPVHFQQWFQLDFVATEGALYLWLKLDVASKYHRDKADLLIDVQSARDRGSARFNGDWGEGRVRCFARIAHVVDSHPGQHITIRGCIHAPDVIVHSLSAQAFVAAS